MLVQTTSRFANHATRVNDIKWIRYMMVQGVSTRGYCGYITPANA